MKGFILLILLLIFSSKIIARTATWDGGAGTLVWTTAANWDTDVAPVTGDAIVFNTAGTYTITSIPTLSISTFTVTDGDITLQGASVTLTLSGILSVAAGKSLMLDGTGNIVNFSVAAAPSISGTLTVNSGSTLTSTTATAWTIGGTVVFSGTYVHDVNAGTIPTSTWNAGSTCVIQGTTGTFPTLSQTFHHLTFNLTSLSGHTQVSQNITINGDLTIQAVTSYSFYIGNGGTTYTWTIGGNFNHNAGIFGLGRSSNTADQILDIAGNFNFSAGTFNFSTNAATVNLYVAGNFSHTGGTFAAGNASTVANCTFDGTGVQEIESTGQSGAITFKTAQTGAGAVVRVLTGETFTYSGSASTFTVQNNASNNTELDLAGTGIFSIGPNVTSFTINASATATVGASATLKAYVTITNNGTIAVNGTYEHLINGGTIPTCTWASTSTCLITGVAGINPISNIGGQTYGNFTWNWTTMNNSSSCTLNVGGNITCNGNFTWSGSSSATDVYFWGAGNHTLTIVGDMIISNANGTLRLSNTTGAGETNIVNLQGNFNQSNGTLNYVNSNSILAFNFSGTSQQTFTKSGGTLTNTYINWTVNSAAILLLVNDLPVAASRTATITGTLICGTGAAPVNVTGAGSFILSNSSTAWLKITNSTAGITADVGTATGNILTTTARTFNTGAGYYYMGNAAQITGTGLPSTVGNLTLDNASGVTLTAGVIISDAGTLTLTAGYHNISSFTLQLGTSAANALVYTAGGLYSSSNNGSFKRWIVTGPITSTSGNYYGLFPFKKTATNIFVFELNSTSDVTTAGFVSALIRFANAAATDVADFSDGNGTVTHVKDSKMVTLTLTTIAGGTFTVKASSGSMAAGTLTDMNLSCFTGGVGSSAGTFAATTGTTTYPVVSKTAVATASLAIGWAVGTYNFGATTLPIELISFSGEKDGRNNKLSWETQSESNNDYFTIEKTIDGINFEIVGMENGAGNSDQFMNYSLVDFNVRNGRVNYYRLKQTDFDGNYSYSDIISIDNISSEFREVTLMINSLGQEVNDLYRGLVIIYFSDGTSSKIIR